MSILITEYEETANNVARLKQYDEETLTTPIKKGKWSIREIVGHIYYWDRFHLIKMLPNMTHGADLPPFPDHDQHNEEALEFLQDKSAKEIMDMFIEKRKEFIEEITTIDKGSKFTIGGSKRQFTTDSFLKIFIKHDKHHIKQIEGFLEDLG
ncbi:DinB family protein [Oceanobacillus kimchii]|uniref:DinB family protein n=1 Tax=Oceanobacillus kimchii TaxID=746691 RepID=UPI000986E144|nr:DinB family protein [Oceanobacillus kimchii]